MLGGVDIFTSFGDIREGDLKVFGFVGEMVSVDIARFDERSNSSGIDDFGGW